MDYSTSAIMSSPTKALNPVSPERMNQQTMPPSPSLSSDVFNSRRKGSRGLSEVQAKVAFLNTLSRGNSPAPPASPTHAAPPSSSSASTAALQRALLGREEAESSLQNATGQLLEAQSREQRISEKLETLLEEIQTGKERQSNERSVFEKEIRKARKEAFRAGSAVVKIQEDLKEARSEVRGLKDEVHAAREAKELAKQEAFERAYALAGLTEELEVLKERLRSFETSNQSDALEAQAQEMRKQDIGRMSLAEGDLALLLTPTPRRPKRSADDSVNSPLVNATNDSSTQYTPPKRLRLSDCTPRQGDRDTAEPDYQRDMLDELQRMLENERQRRVDAEEMVHFMEMECQFKRCSCRLAENAQPSCAHNSELSQESAADEIPEAVNDKTDHSIAKSSGTQHARSSQLRGSAQISQPAVDTDFPIKAENNEDVAEEPVIAFSPKTGTFRTIPSPQRPQEQPALSSVSPVPQTHPEDEYITKSPAAQLSTQQGTHLPGMPLKHIPQFQASSQPLPPFTPSPSTIGRDVPQGLRLSVEHSAEFEVDTSGYPITKRVPLRTEPRLSNQSAVPGTPVSREEALAQIRARRGRSNSTKRSVSAGEAIMRSGGAGVPPPASNRAPSVKQPTGRGSSMGSRRDMSAPIKGYHR